MDAALWEMDICEAARRIAARELSPVDLTRAYLNRIEQLDGKLNSFITVTADLAMKQALAAEQELAAGRLRGPLHGIPLSFKDMIDVAGVPTTAHSRILRENVPAKNAAVVERLSEAGAVILGKNATHEFAHGGPSFDLPWPPARNPWRFDHHPGGSSSGSAAAVAANLAAGSLGTDTGGSVRSPSYLCGLVGLKPTFGRVSRRGVVPLSTTCDHVGPLTRSVADCAVLLQAISGHDTSDPASVDAPISDFSAALGQHIKGIRIGIPRHFWEDDAPVSAEMRKAVDVAIDVFRDLGADVETIRLRPLREYYATRIVISESELLERHLPALRVRAADYGEHFLGRILPSVFFSAADYVGAQRMRRLFMDELSSVHRSYDLILTPGTGPAQPLRQSRSIGISQKWLVPNLNTLFSLTGAPALALPCGFTRSGLPLGLQLAGRPFEEALLLRAAHSYEQATRWRDQLRPDMNAPADPSIAVSHDHELSCIPVDARMAARAREMLSDLDLNLTERQFELLVQGAGFAIQFARWVREADETATSSILRRVCT